MCTPKYCEDLSSVIAPTTFDLEKTPPHPRAECNSKCQKEPTTLRREQKAKSFGKIGCVFPHKYHSLNSNEITNILNNFNVNVYTVINRCDVRKPNIQIHDSHATSNGCIGGDFIDSKVRSSRRAVPKFLQTFAVSYSKLSTSKRVNAVIFSPSVVIIAMVLGDL
ncbi:hypothetical protein TNCV_4191171 [Trichonephila clavipes]|nr:hypothetical protein TNCV_4191171 [Trichonephila clavipes]